MSTQMRLSKVSCLVLLWVVLMSQSVSSKRAFKARTCQYENTTYQARETFKPDPCTFCKCPRHGGEPKCAIMDCKWEPHCLRKQEDPSVCCPLCLEYGCLHSDGKVYPRGSLVSKDHCSRCYCPESGGRTLCAVKPCPHPRCVDYKLDPNSCCPVCPNGPNCQFNGTIIASGKLLEIGNRRCRCKRLKWSGGTKLFASCRRKMYRIFQGDR